MFCFIFSVILELLHAAFTTQTASPFPKNKTDLNTRVLPLHWGIFCMVLSRYTWSYSTLLLAQRKGVASNKVACLGIHATYLLQ